MANHASSRRRVRRTKKRTIRNQHVRSTVRSRMRVVREAIKAGNAKDAEAALAVATRGIDMAVSKGVFPRITGSRYISRLSAQVAAMSKKAKK